MNDYFGRKERKKYDIIEKVSPKK